MKLSTASDSPAEMIPRRDLWVPRSSGDISEGCRPMRIERHREPRGATRGFRRFLNQSRPEPDKPSITVSLEDSMARMAALLLVLGVTATASAAPRNPAPPARTYRQVTGDVDVQRRGLARAWRAAATVSERSRVLETAKLTMTRAVTEGLVPFWYGTPWKFEGIAHEPGTGAVACGSFVLALLEDAGFNLPRYAMSIEASERVIRSLVAEAHIRRYSRTTAAEFLADVSRWGPGLYVIGLDFHVGFLLHDGRAVHFIHSSYIDPPLAVVKELASTAVPITTSEYRVIGKLTADDALTVAWLSGRRLTLTDWKWGKLSSP